MLNEGVFVVFTSKNEVRVYAQSWSVVYQLVESNLSFQNAPNFHFFQLKTWPFENRNFWLAVLNLKEYQNRRQSIKTKC